MKIVITGAKGMLGTKLMDILIGHDLIGMDAQELDITDKSNASKVIASHKPDAVINCAAFTRVDDCETKVDLAFAVNSVGPENLALACKDNDVKLVHIGTDYVFDGTNTTPYKEEDKTNPLSIYGKSKLAGEDNIRAVLDNHLIIRTQWLYGENGPNFVETILRIAKERDELRVVNDQWGAPTYTKDLGLAIKALIENDCRGTYHAANSGSCTWYEFTLEILRLEGLEKNVVPVTTEEFARPARRPSYSVFNCDKVKTEAGFIFRHWRDALAEYMKTRRK